VPFESEFFPNAVESEKTPFSPFRISRLFFPMVPQLETFREFAMRTEAWFRDYSIGWNEVTPVAYVILPELAIAELLHNITISGLGDLKMQEMT
jgi:hypothetical protein